MRVMMSADTAEGPRAFLEKRKPVFQGAPRAFMRHETRGSRGTTPLVVTIH